MGVCKYYIGPIGPSAATCLVDCHSCRQRQGIDRQCTNVLILCTEMMWPIVILSYVVTAA